MFLILVLEINCVSVAQFHSLTQTLDLAINDWIDSGVFEQGNLQTAEHQSSRTRALLYAIVPVQEMITALFKSYGSEMHG